MKWGLTSREGKWVEQCWFNKDGIGVDLTADPKDALAFKTDQEAVAVRDALPQGQIAWTVLRLPESFDGDDLRRELTGLLFGAAFDLASNEKIVERVELLLKPSVVVAPTPIKTEPVKPSLPCPHCGGKGTVNVAQNGKLVEQTCSPCKGKGS